MFGSDDEDNKAEPVKLGESADEQEEDSKSQPKIHTIPDAFYGGKNPQVYEKKEKAREKVKEEIRKQREKRKQKEKEEQQEKSQQSQEIEQPEDTGGSLPWLKIAAIGGGLILLLAGVSGYYLYSAGYFGFGQQQVAKEQKSQTQSTEETDQETEEPGPEPEPEPEPEPASETEPETTTSTPETETSTQKEEKEETPTSTLPEVQEKLRFPQILLADSNDLDSDDLTDEEEKIFDTDSGTWDTDGDGYFDGQEIRNLYHPNQSAPTELKGSDLVKDYTNPAFDYKVYYPSKWETAAVSSDKREVLFNAITGDYILVRAVDKKEGQDFDGWFTENIEGESRTDLNEFENKFDVTGYRREDNLVTYFPGVENVYILIYNPGIKDQIPFREVMKMMTQSFRLPGDNKNLSDQNVIPGTTSSPQEANTGTEQSGSENVATTTQNATTTESNNNSGTTTNRGNS